MAAVLVALRRLLALYLRAEGLDEVFLGQIALFLLVLLAEHGQGVT